MKKLYQTFCGALLVLGLAGIHSAPAFAGGYRWSSNCNCWRPADYQYATRRYVRAAPEFIVHKRYVDHTRVVRGRTRVVQENQFIVHVRPVINREVVVHRTHTIVKDVVLHRTRTINTVRNRYYNEVVNVDGGGTVRHVTEYRDVGNCGYGYRYRTSYDCGYGCGYGHRRGLFGALAWR